MTEISPLGSVNARLPQNADWDDDRFLDYARKQGRALFGIELRVRDADGREIAHDGVAFGELEVRGPWVAKQYFNRPGDPAFTDDGWFRTGDVVTVDELGCIEIVDRAKDVIKSGGEWISSITLENLIMGHPAVQQAAVIGIHHSKWDERPLLLVVPKPGATPTAAEILAYYEGKVAKWWMPDQVEFVGQPADDGDGQAVEGRPEAEVQGPLGGVAARSTILARPRPIPGDRSLA